MIPESKREIFIDPAYAAYREDRLFDTADESLSRDGTLEPYSRLRMHMTEQGNRLQTADRLGEGTIHGNVKEYYSLGLADNLARLRQRAGVRLRAFVIFEPPVVSPHLYARLPELSNVFEHVYVHNKSGDGYSLRNVRVERLRKLYWPQPYAGVLPDYWANTSRERRICVVNGNHKPVSYVGELYSKRISVIAQLEGMGAVDLYGIGWARWWGKNSLWLPYWKSRRRLMRVYKGPCKSKHETLSRYTFSLCFENMAMDGYITEKLFDCLYAGAIPIYLGAKDIGEWIPQDVYIDFRKFRSVDKMWQFVRDMDDKEINAMRQTGRCFLESSFFKRTYYDSLVNIFDES